ncbi:hypothetical protein HYN48_14355 [Flavobacterium magnum]|uniref:Lysoplasmalogenase n=1 Tax=Flavobacterium magnum TaxID=2162713 RepID=A0A2S0RJ71_9FLAO|nr:hypothetical protein [Flavobacterium magnum]AWA31181.1 hypothetical protein HYN48_14355 [Flavobacterium magnum]
MKTGTPSLILYFAACILCVLLYSLHLDAWVIYPKAAILPSVFVYYYINNHHSVSPDKAAVFLLSFVADVYILMGFDSSFIVAECCLIAVYLIMIRYVIKDFVTSKLRRKDAVPIAVALIFVTYLLVTMLTLDFMNERRFFYLFLCHGIVLALMGMLAIVNYIAKGSRQTISSVLMWTCFALSDIFYLLYHFYLPVYLFELINISSQVLSYFFMVRYFLRTDRVVNS